MPTAVCLQFHPSFIIGNISNDLNYLKIQFDDATFLINLPALKREIGFKNVNICKMIYRPILPILSECGPAPVTFNSHNKQAN